VAAINQVLDRFFDVETPGLVLEGSLTTLTDADTAEA